MMDVIKDLLNKKRCIDCKFARKRKAYDWRCVLDEDCVEIHPLFPACPDFEPKEGKNEKNRCS